jgi:hypothetical protein
MSKKFSQREILFNANFGAPNLQESAAMATDKSPEEPILESLEKKRKNGDR